LFAWLPQTFTWIRRLYGRCALSGEDGRLDSCDQSINGACRDVFVSLPHHCSAYAGACLLTRADAECAASACVGCSACVPRILHPSDTTSSCMRGRERVRACSTVPVVVRSRARFIVPRTSPEHLDTASQVSCGFLRYHTTSATFCNHSDCPPFAGVILSETVT
jgi:hypothetical protein